MFSLIRARTAGCPVPPRMTSSKGVRHPGGHRECHGHGHRHLRVPATPVVATIHTVEAPSARRWYPELPTCAKRIFQPGAATTRYRRRRGTQPDGRGGPQRRSPRAVPAVSRATRPDHRRGAYVPKPRKHDRGPAAWTHLTGWFGQSRPKRASAQVTKRRGQAAGVRAPRRARSDRSSGRRRSSITVLPASSMALASSGSQGLAAGGPVSGVDSPLLSAVV